MAERLRGLDTYRAATTVFAEPVPLLHQARINLLLDGKRLVMPSPGLKQGFFLLEPFLVPFPRLPWAVSMTGAAACGRLFRGLGRGASPPAAMGSAPGRGGHPR